MKKLFLLLSLFLGFHAFAEEQEEFDHELVKNTTLSKAISSTLNVLPPSEPRERLDNYATAMAVVGISLSHKALLQGDKEASLPSKDTSHILENIYVNLTAGLGSDYTVYTGKQKRVLQDRVDLLGKHLVFPKQEMVASDWIVNNKEVLKSLPYYVEESEGQLSAKRKMDLTPHERGLLERGTFTEGESGLIQTQ